MTISCPRKALTKAHMSTLVDSPVASESLAKVRVKAFFVAACPAAAKRDWEEDGGGIFGLK